MNCTHCNISKTNSQKYCSQCGSGLTPQNHSYSPSALNRQKKLLLILAIFLMLEMFLLDIHSTVQIISKINLYEYSRIFWKLITVAFYVIPLGIGLILPAKTFWKIFFLVSGALFALYHISYMIYMALQPETPFIYYQF